MNSNNELAFRLQSFHLPLTIPAGYYTCEPHNFCYGSN